jgi:hypothetical protein
MTDDTLVQIISAIMAAESYDVAQALRLSYSEHGYGFTIQDLTESLEPILIFFRHICYWLDVLFNLDEVNRRALKSLMIHITHKLATWQPDSHRSTQMINAMRWKLTSQAIDHMRSAWTALSFASNGGFSFSSTIVTYMSTTLTTKMLSKKCTTAEVHIESYSARAASPLQTNIPTKRSTSPSVLDKSPAKRLPHLCHAYNSINGCSRSGGCFFCNIEFDPTNIDPLFTDARNSIISGDKRVISVIERYNPYKPEIQKFYQL